MNYNHIKLVCLGLCLFIFTGQAQETTTETKTKQKKAWEIGIGGSALYFDRIAFSNFESISEGHQFDLTLSKKVLGGDLYIARELNPYLYLDLQGTSGFTKESLNAHGENQWFHFIQPGLQWRLSPYFNSQYIEPYLRAGIG